jgi:hypothetical protein
VHSIHSSRNSACFTTVLRFRETGFRGQRKMRRNDLPTVTQRTRRCCRLCRPRSPRRRRSASWAGARCAISKLIWPHKTIECASVRAVLYSSIRPAGASPTPLTGVRRIGERLRARKKAADVARQSAPWIVPNDKSEPLTGGSSRRAASTVRCGGSPARWYSDGPGALTSRRIFYIANTARREKMSLRGGVFHFLSLLPATPRRLCRTRRDAITVAAV